MAVRSVGSLWFGDKSAAEPGTRIEVTCGRCSRPTGYMGDPDMFPRMVVLCGPCATMIAPAVRNHYGEPVLFWQGTATLYQAMVIAAKRA